MTTITNTQKVDELMIDMVWIIIDRYIIICTMSIQHMQQRKRERERQGERNGEGEKKERKLQEKADGVHCYTYKY